MRPFPCCHLRRLLRVVNGGTPTSDPENWDGDVPWATPIDLAPVNGKLLAETTRTLTTRGLATGSSEVPPNSLIMSTRAPIGYVAQVTRNTAFNQGCRGLVPKLPVDIRYIRYQLISATPTLQCLGQGSTFLELSSDSLSELPLFVPSVKVQRAIADYLDAETAGIDALIEKKRRMVELLEDRRQGIIDGIMPDSGQPMRVRHLIRRLTSGPRGWAEYVADDGVLFLRITNVQRNDLELDITDSVCVDPPLGAERRRTAVCEGDVLISITADLGSVGIARAEHNGAAVSQHLALMTPQGCPGEWLALSLSTSAVKGQLDMARYGGTKTQLSLEDIRDIKVTVDKTCWNSSVLQAVTNQLNVMRRCQRALGTQIGLLAERRQALITAAVTGELAIPGIAA